MSEETPLHYRLESLTAAETMAGTVRPYPYCVSDPPDGSGAFAAPFYGPSSHRSGMDEQRGPSGASGDLTPGATA